MQKNHKVTCSYSHRYYPLSPTPTTGFWMDVGQPPDYLIGMCMYLPYLAKKGDKTLRTPGKTDDGTEFVGAVMVVRVIFNVFVYVCVCVCV